MEEHYDRMVQHSIGWVQPVCHENPQQHSHNGLLGDFTYSGAATTSSQGNVREDTLEKEVPLCLTLRCQEIFMCHLGKLI